MSQQTFRINLNDEFNASRTPRTLKKTSPHKKESPSSVRRRALLEQWRLKKRTEQKIKEVKSNMKSTTIAYIEETPLASSKIIRSTGMISPTFSSTLKDRRKSKSPNYNGSCQICSRFSGKERDSDLPSHRKNKDRNSPCIYIDRPVQSGLSPSKNNVKSYVTLASENKFSKPSLKICGKTEDDYVYNFKDSCVLTSSNLHQCRSNDIKNNLNAMSPVNITAETTDIPSVMNIEPDTRTPSTLMKEANNVLETAKEMFENRNTTSLPSVRTAPNRNSNTKEKKGARQKKTPKEMGYTASTSSSRKKERKISRALQDSSNNNDLINNDLERNQITYNSTQYVNFKEKCNIKSPKSPKDIAKARMKKMRALMTQKHQGLANEIKELSDTVIDSDTKNEKIENKENKGRVSFATEHDICSETSTTYESKSVYQNTTKSNETSPSQPYSERQKHKTVTSLRSILKKDKTGDSPYPKEDYKKTKSISPKDTARTRIKEMNKIITNKHEAIRAEKRNNSTYLKSDFNSNIEKTNEIEHNAANKCISSSAADIPESKTKNNSPQTKSTGEKPSAETMLRKLALSPISKVQTDSFQKVPSSNANHMKKDSKNHKSTYKNNLQTFEEAILTKKKSLTNQRVSTSRKDFSKSKMKKSAMISEKQKMLFGKKTNNSSYISPNSVSNNAKSDVQDSSNILSIKNNSSSKHTENHVVNENKDILDGTKNFEMNVDVNRRPKMSLSKVTMPSIVKNKNKLESKEIRSQSTLKETNTNTHEYRKKKHKAAPQSLDHRYEPVVVEDASESENESINLSKQEHVNEKSSLESYHLRSFQKSLERIKTQGLSSDEIIKEFCSNSQRVAKDLNEKHHLAKTQSLSYLECNTMIEQTNMLRDAITVLSKKTFEANEKLRAKKDEYTMLEKKNLSLINDIAACRRDYARMTSDLYEYQRNIARGRYSMSDIARQESKTPNTTHDDTLSFSAKEYAKKAVNSNGVDTPISSFKLNNRNKRTSYMKGSFTISAKDEITQHVNPMCEETRQYPEVPHTLGTAFVVDLCGHLNLDVGHHATLASIMDKQWDSAINNEHKLKGMINASF